MRWLDSITDAMDRNLGKLQETVRDREARHAAVHEVTKSDMTGRLNGGAYICMYICICICYACTLCLTHIHFYLVNAHLYLEYTSINTYKANTIIFLCLRISSLILSLLASTLANTLIRKWGRQKKMGRKRRLFSMWLETNIHLILQGGLELSLPFSFVPN